MENDWPQSLKWGNDLFIFEHAGKGLLDSPISRKPIVVYVVTEMTCRLGGKSNIRGKMDDLHRYADNIVYRKPY